MFVTDTYDNNVLNWNTKIQIATKSYLKTLPKTLLCNRITMTVALEAYLEPSGTSTMELFCENN